MNQPTVTAWATALAKCTVNDFADTLGTADRTAAPGTLFCGVTRMMLPPVRATLAAVADFIPAAMVSVPLRENTAGPFTNSAVFPDASTPVPVGLSPVTPTPFPAFLPWTADAAELAVIPVTPGPPPACSPSTALAAALNVSPCTPFAAPMNAVPALPLIPHTPLPLTLEPCTPVLVSLAKLPPCPPSADAPDTPAPPCLHEQATPVPVATCSPNTA